MSKSNASLAQLDATNEVGPPYRLRSVRRRLQVGAWVLRDVREIGGQSWRGDGRRLELMSIGDFDLFVDPQFMRLTSGEPRLFQRTSRRDRPAERDAGWAFHARRSLTLAPDLCRRLILSQTDIRSTPFLMRVLLKPALSLIDTESVWPTGLLNSK